MDSFVLTQTLPAREATGILNDICNVCNKKVPFSFIWVVLIAKVSSEDANIMEWEMLCFSRLLYTSDGLVQDANTNVFYIILCFGKTAIQNSFVPY